MGRDRRIIDELRAFERLCTELAAGATMPEERAGLEFMANCYRAEASCLQTRFPSASPSWILGNGAVLTT
jgi:hypothetical protein